MPGVRLESTNDVAFAPTVAIVEKLPPAGFRRILKLVSLVEVSVQLRLVVVVDTAVAVNPVGAVGAVGGTNRNVNPELVGLVPALFLAMICQVYVPPDPTVPPASVTFVEQALPEHTEEAGNHWGSYLGPCLGPWVKSSY